MSCSPSGFDSVASESGLPVTDGKINRMRIHVKQFHLFRRLTTAVNIAQGRDVSTHAARVCQARRQAHQGNAFPS